MQANGVASSAAQAPTVERLERDEGALTDEQRMSAVMADAALLSELQGSLAEVRSHVGPVLKEVRVPCALAVVLQLLLCCCAAVAVVLLCCCVPLKVKRGQCACYRKLQYQSMQSVSPCSQASILCFVTAGNVHITVHAAGLAAATVTSFAVIPHLSLLILLLFVCMRLSIRADSQQPSAWPTVVAPVVDDHCSPGCADSST